MIAIKRVYEPPSPQDGLRILVERLWPRGVSKKDANVDLWLKDVAPSTELRRWFGHDSAKWEPFVRRYWQELSRRPDVVAQLRRLVRGKSVTFVYAAHDVERNGAIALRAFLSRPRSKVAGGGA